MNYKTWEEGVSAELKGDRVWKVESYRLALFAFDIAWQDVLTLSHNKSTVALADQLYRAVGSIGANITEGFSRGSTKDRARFYEYALGSARECRHWYSGAKYILSEDVIEHRLQLLGQIIRLLLTTIPEQRAQQIREAPEEYTPDSSNIEL